MLLTQRSPPWLPRHSLHVAGPPATREGREREGGQGPQEREPHPSAYPRLPRTQHPGTRLSGIREACGRREMRGRV